MVLADGDVAYVITSRWSLLRLKEKDTASKIEVLLRKSMYPLAISLATEEQWDVTERLKLFKQYGDYLFKKADFDGAIRQYSATIGYVQSSYVIRKFLDPQRMNNLTFYLEKLHEAGLATSEHTTLLLSCYTRMKDDEKLAQFINSGDGTADGTAAAAATATSADALDLSLKAAASFAKKNRLTFDVEVALRTLQESGYFEHALRLARLHNEHEWYLRIQLNRAQPDYNDALAYLTQLLLKLPLEQVVPYLIRHGRKIINHKPLELVGLLIKICNGTVSAADLGVTPSNRPSDVRASTTEPDSPHSAHSDSLPAPEDFIPVFADHQLWLRRFLEAMHQSQHVSVSTRMTNTLLELVLEEWSRLQQQQASIISGAAEAQANASDPLILSEQPATPAAAPPAPSPTSKQQLAELKKEIMAIEESIETVLDQPRPNYDDAHALLLCQIYGYKAGELFLLERMQSVDLMLRRYIEIGDDRAILKLLRREGRKVPDLYVQVLSYFVHSVPPRNPEGDEEEDDERWTRVAEVLALIEQQQSLPAVEVINILAQNPELPILVASKYIKKVLHQDSNEIQELEAGVASVKSTIATIMQSSQEPNKTPKSAQKLRAKGLDALSDDQNEEDVEEEEEEDNVFAELRRWEEIRNAQAERAGDHEAFYKELEHSTDGFATIASYFGKAMLS